jgi:hypothetical protein
MYKPTSFEFLQGWLKSLYVGTLPLLLAIFSLLYIKKRRIIVFFLGLFLVFTIFSLGANVPLYHLLYRCLPFLWLMRYPVKFFCIATFALSVLAGFGFHFLLNSIRAREGFYLKPLIAINIVYWIGWAFGYIGHGNILRGVIKRLGFFDSLPKAIERFDWGYGQYMENVYFVCSVVSVITLFLWLVSFRRLREGVIKAVLIGCVVGDLFYFGMDLNPLISKEFYYSQPKLLKAVKGKANQLDRVMVTPMTYSYYRYLRGQTFEEAIKKAKETLIPNIGLRYRIFGFGGYGSLLLNDFESFKDKAYRLSFHCAKPLLSLANVRYLITKWKIDGPGVRKVYDKGIVRVYENLDFLPRVLLVPKAIVIKDKERILRVLGTSGFDPKEKVILEEDINLKGEDGDRMGRCRIVEYGTNKIIIKASSSQPAFLFLSDTYYPGWKAYINGVEAKIYRANYVFRAIQIPAGDHKVEFVYRPSSFRVGVIGSLATIACLLGYWIIQNKRR